MYRVPGGYPEVIREGPHSLHFRGKRPIPHLQNLQDLLTTVEREVRCAYLSRRAAAKLGRAELRALTFLEVRYGAISAKMQTAGTLSGSLWGSLWVRVHFAGA